MSIPTQRTFRTLPDLAADMNATAERIAAEKPPAEPMFVWVAPNGDKLGGGDLMTVEQAAMDADARFKAATVSGDGSITVQVWQAKRKYFPTTPNRPALMWFRDGDMTHIVGDGQLGDHRDVWFTCDQAAELIQSFTGVRLATVLAPDRIHVVSESGARYEWHGTTITPEDVTLDDIERLRGRDFRMLNDGQWEALLALLTVQVDGAGGKAEHDAMDAFLVRMIAPVKSR